MSERIDFDELFRNAGPEDRAIIEEAQRLREYVYSDPEARAAYLRSYKKKNPNAVIPELDSAEASRKATEDATKPLREKIDAFEKERGEEKSTNFWGGVRKKAEAGGVEFDDVQKLMSTEGISNPDVAVAYLKAQTERPAEEVLADYSAQLPGKTDEDKGLLEDPIGWSRREAARTIQSFTRARSQ
ncbi:MAG: hypothetical protein ACRD52_00700 [Candidatus Acidiferrales bacterium]